MSWNDVTPPDFWVEGTNAVWTGATWELGSMSGFDNNVLLPAGPDILSKRPTAFRIDLGSFYSSASPSLALVAGSNLASASPSIDHTYWEIFVAQDFPGGVLEAEEVVYPEGHETLGDSQSGEIGLLLRDKGEYSIVTMGPIEIEEEEEADGDCFWTDFIRAREICGPVGEAGDGIRWYRAETDAFGSEMEDTLWSADGEDYNGVIDDDEAQPVEASQGINFFQSIPDYAVRVTLENQNGVISSIDSVATEMNSGTAPDFDISHEIDANGRAVFTVAMETASSAFDVDLNVLVTADGSQQAATFTISAGVSA